MQLDCLSRLGDRILNRTPRGRTSENVRHRHSIEVRVLGFFDLNAEAQLTRSEGNITT